jgi:hypothetical protein
VGARIAVTLALVGAGVVVGDLLAARKALPRVQAVTSQADGAFAVCTVPIDGAVEGFFMLDFETGDLSGGVLNPTTSLFGAVYKHNVLKDLGFKPGQVKNPKFLLVAGLADLRRAGNASLAQSVLYVTDSSTGTTVAYGIPWSMQQPQAASPLVPLDIARPRGAAKAK